MAPRKNKKGTRKKIVQETKNEAATAQPVGGELAVAQPAQKSYDVDGAVKTLDRLLSSIPQERAIGMIQSSFAKAIAQDGLSNLYATYKKFHHLCARHGISLAGSVVVDDLVNLISQQGTRSHHKILVLRSLDLMGDRGDERTKSVIENVIRGFSNIATYDESSTRRAAEVILRTRNLGFLGHFRGEAHFILESIFQQIDLEDLDEVTLRSLLEGYIYCRDVLGVEFQGRQNIEASLARFVKVSDDDLTMSLAQKNTCLAIAEKLGYKGLVRHASEIKPGDILYVDNGPDEKFSIQYEYSYCQVDDKCVRSADIAILDAQTGQILLLIEVDGPQHLLLSQANGKTVARNELLSCQKVPFLCVDLSGNLILQQADGNWQVSSQNFLGAVKRKLEQPLVAQAGVLEQSFEEEPVQEKPQPQTISEESLQEKLWALVSGLSSHAQISEIERIIKLIRHLNPKCQFEAELEGANIFEYALNRAIDALGNEGSESSAQLYQDLAVIFQVYKVSEIRNPQSYLEKQDPKIQELLIVTGLQQREVVLQKQSLQKKKSIKQFVKDRDSNHDYAQEVLRLYYEGVASQDAVLEFLIQDVYSQEENTKILEHAVVQGDVKLVLDILPRMRSAPGQDENFVKHMTWHLCVLIDLAIVNEQESVLMNILSPSVKIVVKRKALTVIELINLGQETLLSLKRENVIGWFSELLDGTMREEIPVHFVESVIKAGLDQNLLYFVNEKKIRQYELAHCILDRNEDGVICEAGLSLLVTLLRAEPKPCRKSIIQVLNYAIAKELGGALEVLTQEEACLEVLREGGGDAGRLIISLLCLSTSIKDRCPEAGGQFVQIVKNIIQGGVPLHGDVVSQDGVKFDLRSRFIIALISISGQEFPPQGALEVAQALQARGFDFQSDLVFSQKPCSIFKLATESPASVELLKFFIAQNPQFQKDLRAINDIVRIALTPQDETNPVESMLGDAVSYLDQDLRQGDPHGKAQLRRGVLLTLLENSSIEGVEFEGLGVSFQAYPNAPTISICFKTSDEQLSLEDVRDFTNSAVASRGRSNFQEVPLPPASTAGAVAQQISELLKSQEKNSQRGNSRQ